MKIVVFSALNLTNERSTRRNRGLQEYGCSNQLIAVMVLDAGDGIRFYPLKFS
jgi:hypothetical protein